MATTYGPANTVWTQWCNSSTTSTSAIATDTWQHWNTSTTSNTYYMDNVTTWRDWNTGGTQYDFQRKTNEDTFVWKVWISDESLSHDRSGQTLRLMAEEAKQQLDRLTRESQTGLYGHVQTYRYIQEVEEVAEEVKEKLSRHERRRQRALAEQRRKKELEKQHEAKRKQRSELRRRQRAEQKAVELLTDIIGEAEAKVYEETGRLFVKGNKFDWLIERQKSTSGDPLNDLVRMKKLRKGSVSDLCVRVKEEPGDRLPCTDKVIALALHAKLSEDEFNKTANPMHVGTEKSLYPKGFPKAANM